MELFYLLHESCLITPSPLLERMIHLFFSIGDNLFHFTLISILYIVENHDISLNRKMPSTNQTYLCHLCLGHINLNRIQRLVKFEALHFLVPKDFLICKSCIEGKGIRRPFITKGIRTKKCLELI